MINEIASKIAAEKKDNDFAAVDFDNTCIVNDIEEALLAYMCEMELIRNQNLLSDKPEPADYHKNIFLEYHRLLKDGSMEDAYLFAVRTLAGYTENEITSLVAKTIEKEGEEIGERSLFGVSIAKGIKPREKIFQLLKLLNTHGLPIWIITASSEIVVKAALKYFGLEFPCIGLRSVEKDSKLTEEITKPFSIGPGKVDCIKKYIDPVNKPAIAVGDSKNDLPMLEYSLMPIVVDRGNSLSEEAKRRKWLTISGV